MSLVNFFNEGAQDPNFRRQADDSFNACQKQVNAGRIIPIAAGEQWLSRDEVGLQIDNDDVDVVIAFTLGKTRPGGTYQRGPWEEEETGGFWTKPRITLWYAFGNGDHFSKIFHYLNGSSPMSNIEALKRLAKLVLNEKYVTYIHEYVHFMDAGRIKTAKKLGPKHIEGGSPEENAPYFNDAHEMNAFMQSMLQYIQRQVDSGSEWMYTLATSTDAEFFGDVMKAAEKMQPGFTAALTPENKRKFQKRVYQLIRHLRGASG
jgi:hypothetical protein